MSLITKHHVDILGDADFGELSPEGWYNEFARFIEGGSDTVSFFIREIIPRLPAARRHGSGAHEPLAYTHWPRRIDMRDRRRGALASPSPNPDTLDSTVYLVLGAEAAPGQGVMHGDKECFCVGASTRRRRSPSNDGS